MGRGILLALFIRKGRAGGSFSWGIPQNRGGGEG